MILDLELWISWIKLLFFYVIYLKVFIEICDDEVSVLIIRSDGRVDIVI